MTHGPNTRIQSLLAISFITLLCTPVAATAGTQAPALEPISDSAKSALRVGTISHEGKPSLAWSLDVQREVNLECQGTLGRAPQYLILWMHLPAPVTTGHLVVTIGKNSAEMDLSWAGWRRLVLPIEVMRKRGESAAAEGKLRLSKQGDFPAEFTVHVQGPQIVNEIAGTGITNRDLLDHIDLDRPELVSVKTAWAAGNEQAALAALVTHFRQNFTARLPARPTLAPNSEEAVNLLAEADKLLIGEVKKGDHVFTFPNGDIDWKLNPTLGLPNFTFEWGFSLNRHGSWETLGQAYQISGNEKYADLWARQLRRWVEQCPAPAIKEERGDSTWRGLEAGLRQSRAWPATFFTLATSKSVTDEDILLFLRSQVDHGNFLALHRYRPGNHFILAMCGLYTQGVVFPEIKDASFWRRQAIAQLTVSLDKNVTPEGAWQEFAPGYHQWVVSRTLSAFRIARLNGLGDEVSPKLWAKLERMAEWNVRLAGPDGRVPALNDGGVVVINESVAINLDVFPNNPFLRWASSQAEGSVPAPAPSETSYALPDSGYTVMRTGWGKTDSYVLLDVGPLAGWHGHQDALNLVTYFNGRPFLFDNGGWAYDSSIWRKYGPATASHNTVLVDGLGQYREDSSPTETKSLKAANTPAPRFGTSALLDYASGWYVGNYGTKKKSTPLAQHHREVGLIKSAEPKVAPVLVVLDTLTPNDGATHLYETRWHLMTTKWKEDRKARCLWTTDEGQPNLAILALDGAEKFHADSAVKEPEVLGWSYDGQTGGPYPALTVRHNQKGSGVRRFITVLIPYEGAPGNPVTQVQRHGSNSWTLTIKDRAPITLTLETSNLDKPSFSIAGMPWPEIYKGPERN